MFLVRGMGGGEFMRREVLINEKFKQVVWKRGKIGNHYLKPLF